jgi:type III secretory pathway lipoprotein EscJ
MWRSIIALALVACAPQVGGPVEQGRETDREDGDRLAAQLAQLPGAVRADVTLHRPVRDPLGIEPVGPSSAAVVVVVDDKADRATIEMAARRLVHGAAPELVETSIAVEIGATRPELARVGPFTVDARSKSPLVAALASTFAVIALLACWIAWRERPPMI